MLATHVHAVAPTATHTHTIILLHGRGSNAREFASEFFESQASDGCFLTEIFPGYRWIFPCAAVRYAQIEQEEMHQWFDMVSVQRPDHDPDGIQLPGLRESVRLVQEIVKQEAAQVGGYDKVFLGGISQGCATAITALLACGERLAGFIGMCGWTPFNHHVQSRQPSTVEDEKKMFAEWTHQELLLVHDPKAPTATPKCETTLQTPVLLEHASDDEVVPIHLGDTLRNSLEKWGMKVQWRKYNQGGHWVNEPAGIDNIVHFIEDRMNT